MKAVILVGGEGTRLRPLTCNIPKAIVPILNQPFLEHLAGYLREHGITDVILAMGYLPDQIQGSLGDGTQMGVRLTYVMEESPLGTAGAVKNAESFLDGPVVVFNGDILTDIDLSAMIKRHREVKPKVSIALTPVENPTIYGVVETDTGGMVQRFVEKPGWDEVTTNMINAGIYILEPDVLELIPPSTPTMFENYLFPLLLERGQPILGYPSDAYWIDIGTPEKYLKANHDLLLKERNKDIPAGVGSEIHSTARIEGPVLIAEGCMIAEDARVKGPVVLGPHCEIGRGAAVEGAVLWNHSKVGEKAEVRNCIVCSCCNLEQGSRVLDDCVLGDGATVGAGEVLPSGTQVWPEGCAEPDTA
jgi:mannose-1-phosphate guanylyltransferase